MWPTQARRIAALMNRADTRALAEIKAARDAEDRRRRLLEERRRNAENREVSGGESDHLR